MGSIIPRKRKDGSIGYHAQVTIKRSGKIVHRETRTFDRKQAAFAWLEKRETELAKPGAVERQSTPDPKLAAVIDRYIEESVKKVGRTKAQVLATIKNHEIADLRCSEVTSERLIAFAKELQVQPQTVGNYLSHLGSIFTIARPAWGYPLDAQAMEDAFVVARKLGLSSKSIERHRRPTLAELDLLMNHFGKIQAHRPRSNPMQQIIAFAIFSTRRQEEITRIAWANFEPAVPPSHPYARVLIRDMKHPGDKEGNDVFCDLPPEASAIIEAMPRREKEIFPYSVDAISAAFTRACKILGIDDLHFHDLRHDGVSRLFEMGKTIPQAAVVSGHRSWSSLKRYSHLRQTGDKYADWKWLPTVIAGSPA
jgi:integrase